MGNCWVSLLKAGERGWHGGVFDNKQSDEGKLSSFLGNFVRLSWDTRIFENCVYGVCLYRGIFPINIVDMLTLDRFQNNVF